jgi:hypothetical protein
VSQIASTISKPRVSTNRGKPGQSAHISDGSGKKLSDDEMSGSIIQSETVSPLHLELKHESTFSVHSTEVLLAPPPPRFGTSHRPIPRRISQADRAVISSSLRRPGPSSTVNPVDPIFPPQHRATTIYPFPLFNLAPRGLEDEPSRGCKK